MTVNKNTTKKAAKHREVKRDYGLVQIRRTGLKLALSPSGVRELRSSLEAALGAPDSSSCLAQVRIDPSDLSAISICLGPAAMKKVVGRLRALSLGGPR